MKGEIKLDNTRHKFVKTNLITLEDGSDNHECEKCGIKGNRPLLSDYIHISRTTKELFYNCTGVKEDVEDVEEEMMVPVKLSVKLRFKLPVTNSSNLTKGSIHKTVSPPKEHAHLDGLWVQGDIEPVRLLSHEYDLVEEN